jgi:hypothetical protein
LYFQEITTLKPYSKWIVNILSSILILALVVSGLPVLGKGLSSPLPFYDNDDWDNYKFSDEKIDILVVGNSHARYGIHPHIITDITHQNTTLLAAGGMNLPWLYYGLEEVLKFKVPELIIVETFIYDVRTKNAAYTPMARTIYGNDFFKALPTLLKVMDWSNIFYAWSPLIRYHDEWEMPLSEFVNNINADHAAQNPRYDGYVFDNGIVGPVKYSELYGTLNPNRNLPYDYQYYTEQIIQLGEEYEVPIIFVKMPTVDGYGVHDDAVDKLISGAGGIFYDFNTLYIDQENYLRIHFKDAAGTPTNSHQNSIGALQSTVLLTDIITETMNVPVDTEVKNQFSNLFVERLDIYKNDEDGSFHIEVLMDQESNDVEYEFELITLGKSLATYSTNDNYWIVEYGLFKAARQLRFTVKSNQIEYRVEGIYPIN